MTRRTRESLVSHISLLATFKECGYWDQTTVRNLNMLFQREVRIYVAGNQELSHMLKLQASCTGYFRRSGIPHRRFLVAQIQISLTRPPGLPANAMTTFTCWHSLCWLNSSVRVWLCWTVRGWNMSLDFYMYIHELGITCIHTMCAKIYTANAWALPRFTRPPQKLVLLAAGPLLLTFEMKKPQTLKP